MLLLKIIWLYEKFDFSAKRKHETNHVKSLRNVQYSKLKLRLIIKSLEELPRTKSH